jgi:hypothetical protein
MGFYTLDRHSHSRREGDMYLVDTSHTGRWSYQEILIPGPERPIRLAILGQFCVRNIDQCLTYDSTLDISGKKEAR